MEYAVTDTEENLPGQMTFGMEESESGLEEFSDEETKAEDPVQTEEISVDEEITAETDADGFRAVEETDEVPFDEDDEISFDAEEEEETPEETAEETVEDIDNVEDAEDEVKWAEKVICNFGVYAEPSWGNDAGCQRLPDDQMAGTALQRPESGNTESCEDSFGS